MRTDYINYALTILCHFNDGFNEYTAEILSRTFAPLSQDQTREYRDYLKEVNYFPDTEMYYYPRTSPEEMCNCFDQN